MALNKCKVRFLKPEGNNKEKISDYSETIKVTFE